MNARTAAVFVLGLVIGAIVTWASVHADGASPIVFRGTTQGVTSDGDGVAFHPIEEFTDLFDGAFPAFEVSGDNRTSVVSGEVCLAPGTAEQDVVFEVVDTGTLALAWYACLSQGISAD